MRVRLPALLAPFLAIAWVGCGSSNTTGEAPGPADGAADAAPHDAPQELAPESASEADAPSEIAPATCTPDADGDNIPDEVEGKSEGRDTDGDGTPDYLDLDSDNDSIPDRIEGDTADMGCLSPLDSDGDKKPDYVDTDSDDNGLPDRDEVYPDGAAYDPARAAPNPADSDGDGRPDYADKDNDGDDLDDLTELGGAASQDTDNDGLPDIDDPDSDGDTIKDGQEGAGDFDGDGTPNFRDLDSDADGVPDPCEAGKGHTIDQVPADSDKDGKYDFVDVDSDSDGLMDSSEDKNGNCVVDPGETDRTLADTDGDGASDLIEVTLGSNPGDPLETPETLGKFYFVIPNHGQPKPDQHTLAIKTTLSKADVGFAIDTTGTMAEELNNLKGGLQTIVQTLLKDIPELAVGISAFDDYPVDPYGVAAQSDKPFYLSSPAGMVSTVYANAQAAVAQLSIHSGGDLPESQVAALWLGLTNQALQWPGVYWPPSTIPSGRYGALAYRPEALPILVAITDAPFHNGRRSSDPSTMHDPYSFNATSGAPTMDDLVGAMKDSGARFVGFASDNGVRSGDPYEDMAYLCDQTDSYVSPAAFGGACMTGIGGSALPNPDGPGGSCRLVFDVYQNGDGLTERIADGITSMLKGLLLDMRVVAISDPVVAPLYVDSVDEFVDHVTVNQLGADDPTDPGVPCWMVPSSKLADKWSGAKGMVSGPDAWNETVMQVVPTTKICFDVVPKMNTTVPETNVAQVFHAVLQVRAKKSNTSEINLGQPRDVLFVVPPKPQ